MHIINWCFGKQNNFEFRLEYTFIWEGPYCSASSFLHFFDTPGCDYFMLGFSKKKIAGLPISAII